MLNADRIPDAPAPEHRFRRKASVRQAIAEVWRFRELVRTLAERELRARYKQASLGFAWAVVAPVGLLLVFTFFVQRVGEVFTEGVPYQLYAYLGLITWSFFSSALGNAGQALLTNMTLMNKVNCPRAVFPLAAMVTVTVDTLTASLVLLVLFPLHGFWPQLTTLWFPAIFLVQLAATLGLVLIMSAAIVYVRDLRHAIPLALQLGIFVTPVAYSLQAIPERWRSLYCFANPIGGVIDSYRSTILLGKAPAAAVLGPAALSSVLLLVLGIWVFKRLETGLADVA